jgi:hypothetical protein
MNNNAKAALGVGGIILGGTAGYALYKYLTQGQTPPPGNTFLLQILPGSGGTTTPAPSPSGIVETANQVVTITAVPNDGYSIGQWIIDGVDAGNSTSLSVTMNMDHTVIVTFWEGGVPPPSVPVAITCLGSVQVMGYYGAKATQGTLGGSVSVKNCDQNWTWENWAQYIMIFKVVDASGNGVPNVPVRLYPDLFPDTGKYKGYLALNLQMITSSNPLNLITDQNGLITVSLTYIYGLNDNIRQLCADAGLYLWSYEALIVWGTDVQDGVGFGGWIYNKGGDGTTGTTAAMGPFVLNSVHAQITGTSIPEAQGLAYCGFHVKMF